MRLKELRIQNYKSISDLRMTDIEKCPDPRGQEQYRQTAVLDAIRVVTGNCAIEMDAFQEDYANIEISLCLILNDNDLQILHHAGKISTYRRFDKWFQDFKKNCHPMMRQYTPFLSHLLPIGMAKPVTAMVTRRIISDSPPAAAGLLS